MADRKIHWRCFHCGDTFTKGQERWAREHFGRDEGEEPVCLIRTAGEGALLTALRNAQDELAGYRSEDGDLMRALLSMQADHAAALRDTEERGYVKGLADGRAERDALNAELGDAVAVVGILSGTLVSIGGGQPSSIEPPHHPQQAGAER